LGAQVDVSAAAFTPHHNLAPTDMAPVIDASRRMTLARWGLVPHWAKPDTFKAVLFNARSETMFEKPSFRDAARAARCVVPASGFYEWRNEDGVKQPYWIARQDGEPLLLAGLYADRAESGAFARTFTVVTQPPGPLMQQLHDRQPVMLQTGAVDTWLNPDVREPDTLQARLDNHSNDGLVAHPVDRAVGRAGTEGAHLTEPTGPALTS
jgi:putative SOS response-associated peptidase YedK